MLRKVMIILMAAALAGGPVIGAVALAAGAGGSGGGHAGSGGGFGGGHVGGFSGGGGGSREGGHEAGVSGSREGGFSGGFLSSPITQPPTSSFATGAAEAYQPLMLRASTPTQTHKAAYLSRALALMEEPRASTTCVRVGARRATHVLLNGRQDCSDRSQGN
jgi:hypothetical protein